MKKFDFKPIADALTANQAVLILLPQNPTLDQVASGLSIHLALKEVGKNISITCSTPMTVEFNHLVGVNKIQSSTGGKNLIISFDYVEDSIEKVSYNIEGQKFNLVIEPKPNFPPFDPNKVQYSHSGITASLIIAVGGQRPEDFGSLFHQERQLFTQKTLINLDNAPTNTQFGQINLTDETASSCSEITVALLQGLNLKMSQDIASNLLIGLTQATKNFQNPKVTGDTFEAAAICMDYGARTQLPPTFSSAMPSFHPQPPQEPVLTPFPQKPFKSQIAPSFSSPLSPSIPKLDQTSFPRGSQPPAPQLQNQTHHKPLIKPKSKKRQPSSDWLRPKIYSGSTKL